MRTHDLEMRKVLPAVIGAYNGEAEQVVLGAIFIDNTLYHPVSEILRPSYFGNALHARIFEAAAQLIKAGQTANPITLRNLFDQDGTLADVGGLNYLVQLASAAATIVHPLDYAHNIVDLALRREIVAQCEATRDDALRFDLQRPAVLVVNQHATAIAEIRRRSLTTSYSGICTRIADWLERDLAEPDYLLGNVLSTTSRMLLVASTGLGKTNLAMALGMAAAAGCDFLHWRGSGRPRRALFVDGEMSNRLTRRRLADAARRLGSIPETFNVLCRDDAVNMPPLDSEAGQQYVDGFIESIDGVDLIIFDNIQALLTPGENFGADSWDRTLPWIRDLTRRSIGQIWVHHTGLDESRSYGSKTREWQIDVVCLLERMDDNGGGDIKFKLSFTKARERTPENRADFEPAVVALANDEWTSERGNIPSRSAKRRPAKARALELLEDEIARHGVIPAYHANIPADIPCIDEASWRRRCKAGSISEGTDEADDRAYRRSAKDLLNDNVIGKEKPWVWIVKRPRPNGADKAIRTTDNRTPL